MRYIIIYGANGVRETKAFEDLEEAMAFYAVAVENASMDEEVSLVVELKAHNRQDLLGTD